MLTLANDIVFSNSPCSAMLQKAPALGGLDHSHSVRFPPLWEFITQGTPRFRPCAEYLNAAEVKLRDPDLTHQFLVLPSPPTTNQWNIRISTTASLQR